MTLSASDANIFRAAVKADATVATAYANKDGATICTNYNADSNPVVTLWRPNISSSELNDAIVWSEFVGLTALQQNTYLAMVTVPTIDATNSNIRGGFSTVFSGKTSLTNLTALAQVTATKFQAISGYITVSGTANISTQFGVKLAPIDVINALWLPDGTPL